MREAQSRFWISVPIPLRAFILLLSGLTLACGLAELVAVRNLHLGITSRYSYPLLWEFYPDFRYFDATFHRLHTLAFFTNDPAHPFMYPAPVALPYALFYLTGEHSLRYFLATILFCSTVAALLFAQALHIRGLSKVASLAFAGTTLILSYPLWFVFHQANMEFAVWVILSLGLFAFFHRRPYLAGICFGIAGSMKLFPFIYLGLLLARKQYRAVAVSLGAATVLTLGSLYFVYPNIAVSWHYIQGGVATFREMFMLHLRPERGFDHSLFGLFKQLMPRLPQPPRLGVILSAYLLVAACAGTLLYVVRIRKLPITNQLLCLSIASILLPPTSFDYTLIHLYAPWVLLVLYAVHQHRSQGDRSVSPALLPALLCFAVLFAPLTEFIANGETIAGPIRALVLVQLFVLALTCPFDFDALEAASGRQRLV